MSDKPLRPDLAIAVLLPCYNEEKTIGEVVMRFRAAIPEAARPTSTTTI